MEGILATESLRYEKTLDDRHYFWLMLYKQDEDNDVQYASYYSLNDGFAYCEIVLLRLRC